MRKPSNFKSLIAINDFYSHITKLLCISISFDCLVCHWLYSGGRTMRLAFCHCHILFFLYIKSIENEKQAPSQIQILHIYCIMQWQSNVTSKGEILAYEQYKSFSPSNHTHTILVLLKKLIYRLVFSFVFPSMIHIGWESLWLIKSNYKSQRLSCIQIDWIVRRTKTAK